MSVGNLQTEGDLRRFVEAVLQEPGLINYKVLASRPTIPAPYQEPDLGTHFGDRFAVAPASQAALGFGTEQVVQVVVPVESLLTGIRYRVGATSSGTVRSALYDASGTRVANRVTGVTQSAANNTQAVAFDATYTAAAGFYFLALGFSSNTATFQGGFTLVPSAAATPGTSITPPTAPDTSNNHPVMSLY